MTRTIDQIDRQYTVNLQGRTHVTYDGLLDLAHKMGLATIEVEVLQFPAEANKWVAICRGTVVLVQGEVVRTHSDIADASAANCSKGVALHYIRMAATRAKARALRDALNIKGAALEEFGPDVEPTAPAAAPASGPDDPITSEALQKIGEELARVGWHKNHTINWCKKHLREGIESAANLTIAEGRKLYGHLRTLPDAESAA